MLDESDAVHHRNNQQHNNRRRRGISTPSGRPRSAGSSNERRRVGGSRRTGGGISTAAMLNSSSRRMYKLAIPERCSASSGGGDSAINDEFSKTAPIATSSLSSASAMEMASAPPSSRMSTLQSLRMTLRKHKTQRNSISTTGTSVVTVCDEDEEEEEEKQQQRVAADALRRHGHRHHHQQPPYHPTQQDDDEENIAILQPEEDESASPETRVGRWRRSISSMRMALTRSSSTPSASTPSGSPFPSSSSPSTPSSMAAALRRRTKKAPPTMYSISFYPWKRDPRAYYSNPEAAAEWVPDTASKRCQICLAAFHLTRRRHHCRLCGLLACNDCSLQRTYFPFAKGNRSRHHLIKDGAPQRTCNACAGTLKNMAAQSDPRVKQFSAHAAVTTDPFGMRDDSVEECSSYGYATAEPWGGGGDDDIYVIDSKNSRLQFACGVASQSQSDELDEVLRARARSRKNPQPKYYVVTTAWLEQWLQYVHIDAPTSRHGIPSRKHKAATQRVTSRHVRRPGPITNYALLNFVSGKLVPKDGLERSRGNDAGGDYRIVSEEVWSVFVRLYGGGPCIQLCMDAEDSSGQLQQVVRKHSAPNAGTCAGPTDSSRWVIVELDDSIPALIASEPSDLLKGSRNMRRAASVNSLRSQASKPLKHLSSVHPFHETAPCVLSDVTEHQQQQQRTLPRHDTTPCILSDASDRAQSYYPRDSIMNCITSPPPLVTDRKEARVQKRTQVHHHHHTHEMHETVSTERSSSEHEVVNGSVGAAYAATCDVDESPRATIAAVSAFALAAAEARKKSALSLSRHASSLSSSMVKSSASA